MPTYCDGTDIAFSFIPPTADEPPHVHVVKGEYEAKIWLSDCASRLTFGFSARELREIASGRRASSATSFWRRGMTILQIEVEDADRSRRNATIVISS